MVTSSEAWELRLGDFDFSPSNATFDDVTVEVYGLQQGRPVPVTVAMDSALQDGAVERRTRYDNRDDPSLIVGFKATDSRRQAEVEAMLFLEVQKDRNELAWTPPDGYGATSVFDVLWTDMAPSNAADWDLDELRGLRVWTLTFRCLPFARAETETVVPALASGVTPATTTIADGTSATNWTGTTTITSSGGTLRQTVSTTAAKNSLGGFSYTADSSFTYTPGAPVTAFATQNYLSVDVTPPTGGVSSGSEVTAFADGVALTRLALVTLPTGATRWFFQCADASVSVLTVHVTTVNDYTSTGGSLPSALHQIDNVVATNQAPSTPGSPGREALRTVEVKGSARTPASLAIEHETTGLGPTLIYTNPALAVGGYSPDLRRLRISGAVSPASDASAISGFTSTVDATVPEVFRIPLSSLPRAGFVLLGYDSGLFTDIEVTYSTRLATGALIGTTVTRNRNVRYESGFSVLASLTLPPADVPSSSDATVELSLLSMTSAVTYDELFLCALGDSGALTLVNCGAETSATLGTANNRLWVESASIERPAPTIWLGSAAGQADAYHGGSAAGSWQSHQFVSPLTTVFVANAGGANPAISARYFERAHTHIVGD